MKRIFWTVGVSLAGFFVGGKAGARLGAIIGSMWGASIGYGFGTIFSQKHPTKRLLYWWAVTLGLVGPFFGVLAVSLSRDYVSESQMVVAGAVGAVVAALLGVAIGALQLHHAHRKSGAVQS